MHLPRSHRGDSFVHNPGNKNFTCPLVITSEIYKSMRNSSQSTRSTGRVLFACFVALRPMSTAMVMAGRSVHLTTLFSWASLNKQLTSTSCTYFHL